MKARAPDTAFWDIRTESPHKSRHRGRESGEAETLVPEGSRAPFRDPPEHHQSEAMRASRLCGKHASYRANTCSKRKAQRRKDAGGVSKHPGGKYPCPRASPHWPKPVHQAITCAASVDCRIVGGCPRAPFRIQNQSSKRVLPGFFVRDRGGHRRRCLAFFRLHKEGPSGRRVTASASGPCSMLNPLLKNA